MRQGQRFDIEMSEDLSRSRGRFLLAGPRGLAKDSLKRCLSDFAPQTHVIDVADFSEASETRPTARLMLFDADTFACVLPRHIRMVRDRHRSIRIIAIGNEHPRRAQQLMLSSVDGFVPRSTRLPRFYDALQHVLAGSTHFPTGDELCPRDDDVGRTVLQDSSNKELTNLKAVLTKRQGEVLSLLGVGDSNKQIAQKLGIAEKTVKIHVASICSQLGVDNRTKAAIIGLTMPHLLHHRLSLLNRPSWMNA